jgi:ABC-type polysaccharide/polyol phosphate export permease
VDVSAPPSARTVLDALREHRRLLLELVRRDIRTRFAGARFGLLWSLINPAVQLAAYGLIFGFIYTSATRSRGAVTSSLFCGLWPWWAFQEGVMRGTGAIVEQASLLRRIPMPAALPVVAATIGAIVIQMLGFALFLLVFALLGAIEPRAAWVALPLIVLVQLAVTAGAALVLAPLYLVARDVMYVVNLVLTVGFFFSPVLYQLADVPAQLRWVLALNPLTGLLGMFRTSVLGDGWPPLIAVVLLVAMVWAAWSLGARLMARIAGRVDEYC